MEQNESHIHRFVTTEVPPTCAESGYTLYRCNCGYEHKTNFKPMIPHNFQVSKTTPATCTEPGSQILVCASCGEVQTRTLPALGHNYTNWIIHEYPTCTEPGTRVRKCHRCGTMETAEIPAAGHKCAPGSVQYKYGKMVSFFCQNCGQTINIAKKEPTAKGEPMRFWPTRIVSIFTVLYLLFLCVTALISTGKTELDLSLLYLAIPIAYIAYNVFLFFRTNEIKQAEHYKWYSGFLWLTIAGVCLLVFSYNANARLIYLVAGFLQPIAEMAVLQLFVAVMILGGIKKQRWLFPVLICFAIHFALPLLTNMHEAAVFAKEYDLEPEPIWTYLINFRVLFSILLVQQAMLILPAKAKKPAEKPAEKPQPELIQQ